jgi:hypothetical protein
LTSSKKTSRVGANLKITVEEEEVVAHLEGGFSVMERWGERRRVNKVLEIAYRQMTLALDTVNDLHSTIEATLSKDGEKARRRK